MRVYFDASIIIAAILSPTGGSSELFRLVAKGIIIGISSLTVIEEILEEDKYLKLKKSKPELEQFIAKSGLLIRRNITSYDIKPYKTFVDIEDAHLIAGANLTKCEYLVTLDKKHLLNEEVKKNCLPLKVVNPKELLEEIISR